MRTITPSDVHNFKFVHSAAISSDQNAILFVLTQTKGDNEYSSSIWKHYEGRLYPVISNVGRATNPLWSQDSKHFLFLATSSENGGSTQLWIADSEGMNRRKLADIKNRKIINPKWTKDDRFIFFISDYDSDIRPEPKSDVRVVTRMNYRFDGEGYFGETRPHIFKVSVDKGILQRITLGDFDVSDYDISPDGKSVAFVSNTSKDADYQNNMDIYAISTKGGTPKKLIESKGPIASLSYSPDGKSIAYIGDDYRFKFNTPAEVWVCKIKTGKTTNISKKLDRPARNSIVSDVMMDNWVLSPVWNRDSNLVYFTATDRGRCNIYSSDFQGLVRQVTFGNRVVTSFSLSTNGSLAFVRMDPTHLPELYFLASGSSNPIQLTDFNSDLLSQLKLSSPREFTFRASDKVEVHGFFLPPSGTQEKKKEPPCIVEIHGGGGTEGFQFMHEFQCLAAQGFAVLTCNFRGTAGYGEDYMRVLTGHYMEKDYSDIIEATEYAIKKGWVDKKRLGVTGGSYGGYLTNWTVTHSKLFSAAVTDRSVVNLYSFYGTSDDYRLIEEDVQMSFPWDRPEHYLSKSPIAHTKNVSTPLLIMHADQDFRCRLEQAEQLYAFLKRQGKEAELVIFPGESHGLSRGGKPHHRVERLGFMLWWFTSHINTGKKVERPV